ncbi:hypothetical protein EAX61_03870 [Dokdonia sinensis]|uniref:Cell surface protein n=1 Tax=Dokdonia sinensis TaxID=2479847 RepID=A0A3M0GD60_9FLAO|nr:hypothetical protein [Dokdonia sinensis]RMB62724.1 hypothetical protein EAX61_03870 [Dokdonia sinensis]
MKLYITFLTALVLFSCSENKITDTQDYDKYLATNKNEDIEKTQKELEFWNSRIKDDSLQLISLAKSGGIYNTLFDKTKDINQLKNAEKVLKKSATIAAIKKESYLLSLAQNYISQHRFQDANKVIAEARAISPNKKEVSYLSFDIAMELGKYDHAQAYLKSIENVSDFGYLIRLAKWMDYKGELDKTIHNMEEAKRIADASNNPSLKTWTYTNLADYYGHDGRIKDSYIHYVKSLELDPNNAYAKKGIAWITYSYENNPEEALRILNSIPKENYSPDYYLLKAEIADSQDNQELKNKNLEMYWQSVNKAEYGGMYDAYNAIYLAEEKGDFKEAIVLAQDDVNERPTPETYSTLAYIYNLNGEPEKALKIIKDHVENKTYEPVAHLYMAQVYKRNGLQDKVMPIKKELLEASYELGPVTMRSVKAL